jgi:serine protease Do
VRPEEIKPETEEKQASLRSSGEAMAGKLGLTVRELSDEEKTRTGTEGSLLVEDVAGAAARAGVQPGDVILGISSKGSGSKAVSTVKELQEAAKTSAKVLALLIEREGSQYYIAIPLG